MPVNVFSVSLHFFYIIFLFHLLSKKNNMHEQNWHLQQKHVQRHLCCCCFILYQFDMHLAALSVFLIVLGAYTYTTTTKTTKKTVKLQTFFLHFQCSIFHVVHLVSFQFLFKIACKSHDLTYFHTLTLQFSTFFRWKTFCCCWCCCDKTN